MNALRHPKESGYFLLAAVIGGGLWLAILLGTFGLALLWLLFTGLSLWIVGQLYRAALFGNAVKVSERQYPQVHAMMREACARVGLAPAPDCFLVNGQGAINAAAVRFLSGRYVLLMSDLVDLMLKRGAEDELRMVVGHEVAHHAAGHTGVWRRLVVMPAMFVPFLGAAHSRACELTADRIGGALTDNAPATLRALVSLAAGSESLASDTDIGEFANQDYSVPPIAGFVHELYSTHPRMTRRVLELSAFSGAPLTADTRPPAGDADVTADP